MDHDARAEGGGHRGELEIQLRIEQIERELGNPAIARATITTLEALSDDPHKAGLVQWLQEGCGSNDGRYEIRSLLRCLAKKLEPRRYLEIGTRRGWSLAQVLSETPACEVVSCDMWVTDYADAPNPGPNLVREEIARVTDATGTITFISGNSHDVLPVLFGQAPPHHNIPGTTEAATLIGSGSMEFDLITVDGDHSALGSWWDLCDVMPHVALGGAVVFDDLIDWSDEVIGSAPESRYPNLHERPELAHSLLSLWRRAEERFTNFRFVTAIDFPAGAPPVGFAIRMA